MSTVIGRLFLVTFFYTPRYHFFISEDVKAKWVYLRDGYTSARRRYLTAMASGAAPTEEPKWRFYKHMAWYGDYIKKKAPRFVFTTHSII